MDDERVVLLGLIQKRQGVDNCSPYVSKAGGTPAFYSTQAPAEAANLTCANCSKGLFLVAQVYAPVETDRTLYVFGCNSVSCTEVSGSWRVLRDQVEPVTETPACTEVETVTEEMDQVKLAWGAESDDSDWSDDNNDDGGSGAADLVDLEALLLERDEAIQTNAATTRPTMIPEKTQQLTESSLSDGGNVFPALLIEVVEEPFEAVTTGRDFAHEKELLEKYIQAEEEEQSSEGRDLRHVLTQAKKRSSTVQSTGATSSTGESYEKTPAEQRHLLRFQERISRCPLQCLRYDYGGDPLWPVVKPRGVKVPPCPGCGQERLFEMQLTPTMNYFLQVDKYAVENADSASLQQQQQQTPSHVHCTMAGGPKAVVPSSAMDWLSLVVYSCSASCSASHEEFIYVVPPPTC